MTDYILNQYQQLSKENSEIQTDFGTSEFWKEVKLVKEPEVTEMQQDVPEKEFETGVDLEDEDYDQISN